MEKNDLEAPAILEKRTETVGGAANVQGGRENDIRFLPDFPRQYRENEGITLEIPGTVLVLCQEEDGTLRASSARWEGKLTRPAGENLTLTAIPSRPRPSSWAQSEGKAACGWRLPVQLTASGGQRIPMVSALTLGEEVQPDAQRPSLILRRAGTEGLWELAKKTGSTVKAIREANKLQDEPKPGQMLLIPIA